MLCVTLRNPAIVVENASKYYHHQVALAAARPSEHAKMMRECSGRRFAAAKQKDRGTSTMRGYGRYWRGVRAAHLADEPNCRMCLMDGRIRRAAMVDHIESIAKRPDLRLDDTNLQSLCWPCHNTKTNRFDGGFGRRGGTNIGCFVGSEE